MRRANAVEVLQNASWEWGEKATIGYYEGEGDLYIPRMAVAVVFWNAYTSLLQKIEMQELAFETSLPEELL